MGRDNDTLVFSTDGSHETFCPRCGKAPCACAADPELDPSRHRLRLRLDRKGRGGKAVTVVDELPPLAGYWETLVRQLKAHCGTGGAFKGGALEVQGDQRDKVQTYLEALGFKVRRSGG